jgi:cytochrome c
MSSFFDHLLRWLGGTALALVAGVAAAQQAAPGSAAYSGIGRAATPKELAAWDIDVRPDFKGLPRGSGSVAKGQDLWEAKCASCHGIFGESNEFFAPIVGGTTKEDLKTGRVARLNDESFPGRTTLMKLSSLSTLWDYIHRAMPWTAPKSLGTEEVYAVTAYILNMGGIVPDDFTLSDANIAQVQARLPNRNGKITDHGLWPGRSLGNGGKPDVRVAQACMTHCAAEPKVTSFLPDFARNAHGNLAEQQRIVGAQRGADTTRPAPTGVLAAGAAATTTVAVAPPATSATDPAAAAHAAAFRIAQQRNCTTCHGTDRKIVGPGFTEIARKYAGRADAVSYLGQKIVAGSAGVWGPVPMPAQALSESDARTLAQWLAEGARR